MFFSHFLRPPNRGMVFYYPLRPPQCGKRPHFWQIFLLTMSSSQPVVMILTFSSFWNCLIVCAHLGKYFVHINILPGASFILPGGASRVWLLWKHEIQYYWDMQLRAHGVISVKSQSKSPILAQYSIIFGPSFLHGYSACRRRASDPLTLESEKGLT